MKVLVAHGSENGSTAEIADVIGVTLEEAGLQATVRPAGRIGDVGGYDAVVLGGALYAGRWHHAARRLARRNAEALKDRPVWLFSSGPLDDSADQEDIPPVAQVKVLMSRLGARGHVTFGGRLATDARGLLARAMARRGMAGDYRNRDRIESWARSVAADLATATDSPRG